MKRLFSACMIISMILILPPKLSCQENRKVLLLAREQSRNVELMEIELTLEVNVMIDLLKAAGFQVMVASLTGTPIVAESVTLTPHYKYSDVNVQDYIGLIIPCMAHPFGWGEDPENKAATEIVRQAVALGKPVAAQTTGVVILADAGALDGKPFAMRDDKVVYVKSKGFHKGHGVIRDGNIITSGVCPGTVGGFGTSGRYKSDGTKELTQQFIHMLSEIQ